LIYDYGDVLAIDTYMHGWEGVTAVYYLPGSSPAIIDTGPGSSIVRVLQGLEKAGVRRLDWIVLTHIHLDHAGAAGHLAAAFPNARVVVRAEGAPHLINPERLWASASRLYADMAGLWGEMLPVPAERILAVSQDGQAADLGEGRELLAIHAPGHAKHQMALLDKPRGNLFVGDAIGVRLPAAGVIGPVTPPPEFDLEVALGTIRQLDAIRPSRVFPTHFGPVPDPVQAFEEAAGRLTRWVEAAERVFQSGGGVEEIAEALRLRRDNFYPDLDPRLMPKFEHTVSYDLNARGMFRYFTTTESRRALGGALRSGT
jgi:glyoxylase-like metal-dependent hydrolase (beta-lactamase superfamily II)